MLELYQAENCPYCEDIREKLTELGLSYVIHNPRTAGGRTRNQQTLDEMKSLGGQDQIPFLVDHQHGVERYESEDIIEHLEEHYA
ncbi:MAG: glutathione S-transferase N-terminal domain-containing protein [Halodesulfurarchaeum sp.]